MWAQRLEVVQCLQASRCNGYITSGELTVIFGHLGSGSLLRRLPARWTPVSAVMTGLKATLTELIGMDVDALHTRCDVVDMFLDMLGNMVFVL